MILKLLGFADILAIIALLAASILPKTLIIIMSIYLLVKGLFFLITGGNLITNFLDIVSGFYIIAASFGVSHWIATVIVGIFLLQKALISIL